MAAFSFERFSNHEYQSAPFHSHLKRSTYAICKKQAGDSERENDRYDHEHQRAVQDFQARVCGHDGRPDGVECACN